MPQVAILLCTFDGQRHLAEQLDSLAAQTHREWSVIASDDGSTDETLAVLERYRAEWGDHRLSVRRGPGQGFVANFLSLACDPGLQADCYAYSDQDDIWEPDKLSRAIAWLSSMPADVPALYCARTLLVDADNREIGLSPLFARPPGFTHALVQNIGGGNTMVFNEAARRVLRRAGDRVDVAAHDWWTYLAVTACGGRVFCDPQPAVRYRQHGGNQIGMNSGWPARLTRLRRVARGQWKGWNDRHIAALRTLGPLITPPHRKVLTWFAEARTRSLPSRLWCLKRSGVRRQTVGSNLSLFVAALFGKV